MITSGKISKKGVIHIQTNQRVYNINDTLSGTVSLNIIELGFPGQQVYLKFVGVEDSKKEERHELNKQRHKMVYRLKQKCILKHFLLHDYASELPITQCQFPFEIQLNLKQVGTLYFDFNPQFYCSVEFYLIAYVSNKDLKKQSEIIKYKLPVIINHPYVELIRPISDSQTKIQKKCCCIDSGQCQTQVDFPITDFIVGQKAQFELKVDNTKGEFNVKNIVITFNGQIDITYFNGTYRSEVIQYSQTQLQGFKSGQLQVYNESIDIVNELALDSYLYPTITTPNISYHHFIEITIRFSGFTYFEGDQILSIPVNIVQQPKLLSDQLIKRVKQYKLIKEIDQIQQVDVQSYPKQSFIVNNEMDNYITSKVLSIEQLQLPETQQHLVYHKNNQSYQPVSQSNSIVQIQDN